MPKKQYLTLVTYNNTIFSNILNVFTFSLSDKENVQ